MAPGLRVFLESDLLSSLFVILFMLKLMEVVLMLLKGYELPTLDTGQSVGQWTLLTGAVEDHLTSHWQTCVLVCPHFACCSRVEIPTPHCMLKLHTSMLHNRRG